MSINRHVARSVNGSAMPHIFMQLSIELCLFACQISLAGEETLIVVSQKELFMSTGTIIGLVISFLNRLGA